MTFDSQMEQDSQLIDEIKKAWGKKPPETIRKSIGLSQSVFGFLVGKAGLDWKRSRMQTITTVKWRKQVENGKENYIPSLQVSRRIIRIMDLKTGTRVKWKFEGKQIIGNIL